MYFLLGLVILLGVFALVAILSLVVFVFRLVGGVVDIPSYLRSRLASWRSKREDEQVKQRRQQRYDAAHPKPFDKSMAEDVDFEQM